MKVVVYVFLSISLFLSQKGLNVSGVQLEAGAQERHLQHDPSAVEKLFQELNSKLDNLGSVSSRDMEQAKTAAAEAKNDPCWNPHGRVASTCVPGMLSAINDGVGDMIGAIQSRDAVAMATQTLRMTGRIVALFPAGKFIAPVFGIVAGIVGALFGGAGNSNRNPSLSLEQIARSVENSVVRETWTAHGVSNLESARLSLQTVRAQSRQWINAFSNPHRADRVWFPRQRGTYYELAQRIVDGTEFQTPIHVGATIRAASENIRNAGTAFQTVVETAASTDHPEDLLDHMCTARDSDQIGHPCIHLLFQRNWEEFGVRVDMNAGEVWWPNWNGMPANGRNCNSCACTFFQLHRGRAQNREMSMESDSRCDRRAHLVPTCMRKWEENQAGTAAEGMRAAIHAFRMSTFDFALGILVMYPWLPALNRAEQFIQNTEVLAMLARAEHWGTMKPCEEGFQRLEKGQDALPMMTDFGVRGARPLNRANVGFGATCRETELQFERSIPFCRIPHHRQEWQRASQDRQDVDWYDFNVLNYAEIVTNTCTNCQLHNP